MNGFAGSSFVGEVDGVLLDIDDTLVRTRAAFGEALAAIAEVYFPDLPASRRGEVLAHWRADAGGYYRRFASGQMGHTAQRMARANSLHLEFGGPELDEVGFAAWDEVFEEGFSQAWQAHDDARACVDAIVAAGRAVGSLTNARVDYQIAKLARTGLEEVAVLVGVDTLGVGKPDPRVFVEACQRLGTEPSRTAYVGDELDIDAVASAQAGLLGVWLDRPGERRGELSDEQLVRADEAGVLRVSSLAELPQVLGLL